MNHSTPGLPVHHQLPEFAQTHIHRVSGAIQPSHPPSSPSAPSLNPSQHQSLFQWVNSSYEVAKVWEIISLHQLRKNLIYRFIIYQLCDSRYLDKNLIHGKCVLQGQKETEIWEDKLIFHHWDHKGTCVLSCPLPNTTQMEQTLNDGIDYKTIVQHVPSPLHDWECSSMINNIRGQK